MPLFMNYYKVNTNILFLYHKYHYYFNELINIIIYFIYHKYISIYELLQSKYYYFIYLS